MKQADDFTLRAYACRELGFSKQARTFKKLARLSRETAELLKTLEEPGKLLAYMKDNPRSLDVIIGDLEA